MLMFIRCSRKFNQPRQEKRVNVTDHTLILTIEQDEKYKIYFPDLLNLEYLGIQELEMRLEESKFHHSALFNYLKKKNDSTFSLSEVSVD